METETETNKGGRPPMYATPEEIETAIDEYFESVKGEFHLEPNEITGKLEKVYTRDPEPITITGLCIYLGFESRQSFYDYEKKDGFAYIIKKAAMRVEYSYEKGLHQVTRPAACTIFALKNMGWNDKQEFNHLTDGKAINVINLGMGVKPPEEE